MKKLIACFMFIGIASCMAFASQNKNDIEKTIEKLAIEQEMREVEREAAYRAAWEKQNYISPETIPLSPKSCATEWKNDSSSTNGIVVSVIVGMKKSGAYGTIPYVRDLSFNNEGKLISVSTARLGVRTPYAHLVALPITNIEHELQHTQDHGK